MATFLANLTAGADSILGTAGDDIIQVPPSTSNLSGSDTIAAGAGFDTLLFLRDTSLAVGHTLLTNVSGVDEFDVTLAPSVHIFLNDASILQSDSDRLRITFDADPMTLDLRAVSASLLNGIELNGSGTVTLYDVARQSLRIADGVNGTVIGGIGRDAITGGNGADSLTGGLGDDVLRGNGGDDTLLGGDDQDWLYGGTGNDSLVGGTGFDLLEGGIGTNTATGGTEADTFVVSVGETLTITDFETTNRFERIDLRAFAGLGFADLVIAANGGNARISLPSGSSVTLTGVAAAALRAEMFIFAGDTVVTPAAALGVVPHFEFTANGDSVTGTSGDDVFEVKGVFSKLAGTDRFDGRAGTDTLRVWGEDRVLSQANLAGMQSIEVIDLTGATGSHAVTLTQALVAQSGTASVTIRYGAGDMIVDSETAGGVGAVVVEGSGVVTLRNADGQSVSVSDAMAGRIEGGSRDDEIQGGARNDTLNGNDGNDSIDGGAGDDVLTGGAGDDSLTGGTGTNTVTGGAGTDRYVVTAGETLIITDFDSTNPFERIDLSAFAGLRYSNLVMVDGANGVEISLPGSTTVRVQGISRSAMDAGKFFFEGTLPSLAFQLTTGADSFVGGAGDDLFDVTGNIAQLDETLDHLDGGAGIDTLRIFGADRVLGPPRLDAMQSIEVIDLSVATGNHAVTLTDTHVTGTEENAITIRFGAGNMILDSALVTAPGGVVVEGSGVVTLRNTTGQHVKVSDATGGRIQGGGQDDLITGGALADRLAGNDGNDTIIGGAGNDTLLGGAGDDSLTGGTGTNTVTGGTGTDRYVVTAGETLIITDFEISDYFERIDLRSFAGLRYSNLVMVDGANGVEISLPGSTTVRLQGISRNAIDAGKFFFEGDVPGQAFQLTAGADSFVGGAGDDLFDVIGNIANLDAALDHLDGRAGIDTLRIFGTDRVLSAELLNVMQSIEVIDLSLASGDHAVTLTDTHVSGTENNAITLRFGAGNVILDTATAGGVGAVLVEGSGVVTLRNADGQSVSVSDAMAGRIEGGSRDDEIQGGARNDTLNGNDGNDSIDGGAGDDVLNGGAGDDSLTGGTGTNTVTGGAGTDRYVVTAGETLIITDFEISDYFERIDLRSFAGLRYSNLVMVDGANGVEISLPGSTTVRLQGISRSAMDAGKFFFEGDVPGQAFQLTAGADSFVGGAGDDLFDVIGNIANLDAALDHLDGGAGIDTLRIFGSNRVLSAELLNVMQSIEVIDLSLASGNHAVTLTDTHVSGTENNAITLRFGAGNMILDSGLVSNPDGVVIDGTGLVTLRNTEGQHVNVSDATGGRVAGGSQDDLITGGAQADRLAGNDGDDTITGGGGNDTITGGAGNDRLISSGGDDRLTGGLGNDSFVVLRSAGVTTLTDYDTANLLERIDLTDFGGVARFSDLSLTTEGANVRVTADNLDVLIQGVQASSLDAGDFLFQGQNPLVFNVTPQTPMAELQHLLDEAPPGAVINLAAGVYAVTETLRIMRSDISLIGAGEGQTILRTEIPDANAGETILVQPRYLFNRLGTIAEDAAEGSTAVTLQDGHGLAVGDLLYMFQANDAAWLAATGNADWVDPASLSPDADPELSYLREMHSKIVAINGNTVTLAEPLPYTFQSGVAQAAQDTFLSNVHLRNFSIQGSWGVADPFFFADTKPEWASIAALEFDGVRDSSMRNITITDPAAHGFKMQRNYEVTGEALTTVGAHNKDGSSGYQFYFQESFKNTFTGLTAFDGRHAVLFSSFSAEHYNTIEVLRTNRDINFHGSPDSNNTIFVDRMEQNYPEGSRPQWKAVSPGSYPEHPLSTIEANNVTFRYAITGEDHDTVVAGARATFISTGAGRDTLVGGAGDDTLDGGTGPDTMSGGGGRDRFIRQYEDQDDTILDFQTGAGGDFFVIKGTGYRKFNELVLRQEGANAVLDFGLGGTTTFVNTRVAALQAVNFIFQTDSAPGQTLTPRADQLFILGTDKADTIVATRSHVTSPDFLVRAGKGYDTIVVNTSSLAGNLASMGSFYKVDAFDLSRVATVDISITNPMVAQSDKDKFYLHVGDSGSSVRLDIGTLNSGHSVWVDGSRTVELVGSVPQKLRATDSSAVHIIGSAQDDKIVGGAQNDVLNGGAGNDRLSGGRGDDTLDGGTGADTMIGGQGSDVFYVDHVNDRIIEKSNWTGTDEVIASVSYRIGSAVVERLTLVGDALNGTGNNRKNVITGNDHDNILDGGGNADTMIGGLGNDTYIVDNISDVVIENANEGIDTVRASSSFTLSSNVENIILQDVRDTAGNPVQGLRATGNALDNVITGNIFDNILIGGLGNDTLRGRGGADTFVFNTALGADNVDHIVDFSALDDQIELSATIFGLARGALAADAFHLGSAARDANDRILYDQATGQLYLDRDGSGGRAAELFAILDNRPTISADDFLIS